MKAIVSKILKSDLFDRLSASIGIPAIAAILLTAMSSISSHWNWKLFEGIFIFFFTMCIFFVPELKITNNWPKKIQKIIKVTGMIVAGILLISFCIMMFLVLSLPRPMRW